METIQERRNRTRKLAKENEAWKMKNIIWYEHVATTEGSIIRVHDNRMSIGVLPTMVTDFKMPMNHSYVYELAKHIVEVLNKEIKK